MRIGQLFMIGFEGTETTPELRSFVREFDIGGVILFRQNISSKDQVRRLTDRLQDESGTRLFVAIDQEGGRVQRLPKSCGDFPSMAEVGRKVRDTGDFSHAFDAGLKIAQELAPLGVNLDFAPVLDVNTNPFNPIIGDRSFGSDPDFVAQASVEFMKGLMSGGVLACGKHFPGHGDTDADSHLDLPVLHHTRRRFEICEWKPFRAAIDAGLPVVMTAHLMTPNLDRENPATISRAITTRILREDLNFGGLIVTDDLNMAGIARKMPSGEASVGAILAGADVALICKGEESQRQAIDAVKRAVDAGLISEKRLEQSLERVREIKNRGL